MAEAGILARSGVKVMILNSYLDNATNEDINLVELTPAAAFAGTTQIPRGGINGKYEARGIQVNGSIGDIEDTEVDRDAVYGIVNYRAKNDPPANFHEVRFNCGVVHPCNARYIRCASTTARGIIIHG